MIATLTGKVQSVSGESCVIDVNGVGYQVFMPLPALETISRTGNRCGFSPIFTCARMARRCSGS